MARRTYAARGRPVRLLPSWVGPFDGTMAGDVLLPGPNAHLARTSFDRLAAGAAALAPTRTEHRAGRAAR